MRLAIKSFIVISVIAVGCLTAGAIIRNVPGEVPVGPVYARADLVCKCTVRSVRIVDESHVQMSGRAGIRRRSIAEVRVEDSYKSNGPKMAQVVTVEYATTFIDDQWVDGDRANLRSGETSLLFLIKSKNEPSTYGFADQDISHTTFSRLPQLSESPGIRKLQSALAAVLTLSSRGDRIEAMALLQGFDKLEPDTLSAADPLCSSDDPEIASAAIALFLKTRTPESVMRLANYLSQARQGHPAWALLRAEQELSQIRDPRALPALEQLTRVQFSFIRWAAIDAVQGIGSQSSGPSLIALLDDKDRIVEYKAIYALANIFGKLNADYAPGAPLFNQNPTKYITLWKKWWATDGQFVAPAKSPALPMDL
jgi:hypothetical protein